VSLDLDDLFLVLDSWDMDNSFNFEFDKFLNWDFLDNLDDHFLLNDFLDLFCDVDIVRGIDISCNWDFLLYNDINGDLFDFLNNDCLFHVLSKVSLLDVVLSGSMSAGDRLAFLISGVDVATLNPSLLDDSSWSH